MVRARVRAAGRCVLAGAGLLVGAGLGGCAAGSPAPPPQPPVSTASRVTIGPAWTSSTPPAGPSATSTGPPASRPAGPRTPSSTRPPPAPPPAPAPELGARSIAERVARAVVGRSVAAAGRIDWDESVISVDFRGLVDGSNGTFVVVEQQSRATVVRSGGVTYVNGNDAFWQRREAPSSLAGTWVRLSAGQATTLVSISPQPLLEAVVVALRQMVRPRISTEGGLMTITEGAVRVVVDARSALPLSFSDSAGTLSFAAWGTVPPVGPPAGRIVTY